MLQFQGSALYLCEFTPDSKPPPYGILYRRSLTACYSARSPSAASSNTGWFGWRRSGSAGSDVAAYRQAMEAHCRSKALGQLASPSRLKEGQLIRLCHDQYPDWHI